jgi:hypothetical protein
MKPSRLEKELVRIRTPAGLRARGLPISLSMRL